MVSLIEFEVILHFMKSLFSLFVTFVLYLFNLLIHQQVKFTAEELRRIMDYKHNIRNMSVIAHVDHGRCF